MGKQNKIESSGRENRKENEKGNEKANERKARDSLLRTGEEPEGIPVKGYDFNKGVNWEEIIRGYKNVGFQASHLHKAIEVVNKMIEEKAFIFLGYTSNMVSSGLRDVFRYLVEHKKVNIVVTTAGGIEEDIIKCLGNFVLGDSVNLSDVTAPSNQESQWSDGFKASGKELREKGINRIGNIFVANNRYVEFEKFVQPILEELYGLQKRNGKVITSSEIIWKLGEKINNKESIYYWAWKNGIKVYCPAIQDGALGDNIYFFKFKHPDFRIDITDDVVEFNNTTIGLKKSGLIILGSGIVKHSILNANMLRNGADYAVYVNNAQEFDGSDAGAMPDEAVSWGKIQKNAESIKVFGDATILFPIIVAESFAKG